MRARHDRRVARGIETLVDGLRRCRKDLFFDLLAFAVLPIKLSRERRCFVVILREQKSQGFLRRAQASRSIQSRAEPVANIVRKNWRAHSGDLHQFP